MTPKDFSLSPLAHVSRELGDGEATLIFVRHLRHPPAKVWRALTEPREQLEWLPFVASRALDRQGPVTLRMTDQENGPESAAEILVAEPHRRLAFQWGDDLLTWELARRPGHAPHFAPPHQDARQAVELRRRLAYLS